MSELWPDSKQPLNEPGRGAHTGVGKKLLLIRLLTSDLPPKTCIPSCQGWETRRAQRGWEAVWHICGTLMSERGGSPYCLVGYMRNCRDVDAEEVGVSACALEQGQPTSQSRARLPGFRSGFKEASGF